MTATALGRLKASNAMLWFLAADPLDAAAWGGSVMDGSGGEDPASDFSRALDLGGDGATIELGDGTGVIVQLGDCGESPIWAIDGGIALADWALEADPADADVCTRLEKARPKRKAKKLGEVQVRSGCLALVLPYAKGKFTAAQIRGASGGKVKSDKAGARILVPLENGTYALWHDPIADDDGLGYFLVRVRIVRAKKKATKKTSRR